MSLEEQLLSESKAAVGKALKYSFELHFAIKEAFGAKFKAIIPVYKKIVDKGANQKNNHDTMFHIPNNIVGKIIPGAGAADGEHKKPFLIKFDRTTKMKEKCTANSKNAHTNIFCVC